MRNALTAALGAATMTMACAASAQELEPMPPAGAALGFVPPPRDAGGYRTPNRDLSAAETAWHVRVALNVAALGCRGAGDVDTPAAYDALLAADQAPLAAAYAGTKAAYHARRAASAEAAYDDDMTRLYNFFAQPPAHDEFCAAARTVLDEARGVAPEEFGGFAPHALAALEAPFDRYFAAYDDYRAALATWRERQPPVVIATAAPVPVGPPSDGDAYSSGQQQPAGDAYWPRRWRRWGAR